MSVKHKTYRSGVPLQIVAAEKEPKFLLSICGPEEALSVA
jgi:hypothetical protein